MMLKPETFSSGQGGIATPTPIRVRMNDQQMQLYAVAPTIDEIGRIGQAQKFLLVCSCWRTKPKRI